MSFAWKTMGIKSGPSAFIRYRENSLYRDSLYGGSPVIDGAIKISYKTVYRYKARLN